MTTMEDARRSAPAALRNRDPILGVLQRHLPMQGLVLEVASGTGEHISHFAAANPDLFFQPSDPEPAGRASIDAWAAALRLHNIRPAIALDASSVVWHLQFANAVICINMIHVAPWVATVGLMRGAARVLPSGGVLFLYGPYRQDGRHTAPSNAEFDASLRERNSDWGVRDLEAVVAIAGAHGFAQPLIESMPANNLSLIFRRSATPDA